MERNKEIYVQSSLIQSRDYVVGYRKETSVKEDVHVIKDIYDQAASSVGFHHL